MLFVEQSNITKTTSIVTQSVVVRLSSVFRRPPRLVHRVGRRAPGLLCGSRPRAPCVTRLYGWTPLELLRNPYCTDSYCTEFLTGTESLLLPVPYRHQNAVQPCCSPGAGGREHRHKKGSAARGRGPDGTARAAGVPRPGLYGFLLYRVPNGTEFLLCHGRTDISCVEIARGRRV